MDERILQFRVGIVILASLIIGATLLVWFGGGVQPSYKIYIDFESAPGIVPETPLRKSGVLIGRVSNVELQEDRTVLVTAEVDAGRKLYNDEIPLLDTASLLGDAVINFVPLDAARKPAVVQEIKPGDRLKGEMAANPLDVMKVAINLEDDLRATLASMENAGNKVAHVADGLTLAMGDGKQVQSLMRETEGAMVDFRFALSNINEVLGDEKTKENLRKSIEELPEVVANANATFKNAERTMAQFQEVSERASRNLENLEQITGPLAERGDQLAASIESSIRNLDQLLEQLVVFSKALNQREGTLGRLVNDTEVYDKLNRAADNVEELTRQLTPIMGDVRIFTDKLARDPGGELVKRLFDPRPIGTGLKSTPFPSRDEQW